MNSDIASPVKRLIEILSESPCRPSPLAPMGKHGSPWDPWDPLNPEGPHWAPLGPMGPHGTPWGPWGPWAHGPHGPQGPMGPHGAQHSQFSNFWKNFFQKKYPKIQNVDFGGENQSCSRRNSAHFGTHTVSWGPLNDSFPDFQFFGSRIQDPGSRIPNADAAMSQ